jgi:hypothetical protein
MRKLIAKTAAKKQQPLLTKLRHNGEVVLCIIISLLLLQNNNSGNKKWLNKTTRLLLLAAPFPPAPVARAVGQGIEPTPENPLPGVDMKQVPALFKIMVGDVMHSLRKHLKETTRQSNQFTRYTTGSKDFPWATEEYVWPRPFKLANSPTFAQFLVPYFFRIRFFAPDKYAPHMLPTGQMPCKWHGFDLVDGKTCVCRDIVLNNFVRIFHDIDGSTGGMFSSRYVLASFIVFLKEERREENLAYE